MNGEIIPRVGYRMELPEGFERMHWYGCGPMENYADRKDAAYVGIYEDSVSRQWTNYVRPQETGNHEEVRWMAVTNFDGKGFLFVAADRMAASALHARAEEMVDTTNYRKLVHRYEIPVRKETVLCLDTKHRPLGNASCGPGPMRKYELLSAPTVFSFIMMPLGRSYRQDELVEKARVRMPVCMPVLIERDGNGRLHLTSGTPGATIHYSLNDGETLTYNGPVEFIAGGKVQAYATADGLGRSLTTSVELPVYVDRSAWKVASVSSENSGEEARNAIDGDPTTIWHSRWTPTVTEHPHEIVVDMASLLEVDRFIYTPRNSGNGRIKDYELYFSQDGNQWSDKVKGSFENSASAQVVKLERPVVARYFKLVALSEVHGRQWASAADLNVGITRNLSEASETRQQVVYADSEADNSMKLAADGAPATCWRTVNNQFYLAPYPHELQLALGREQPVNSIRYTPRQDASEGRIARYEVYLSLDGEEWGKAVATGTFKDSAETQTVRFESRQARYVKLQALSAADGGKLAAIAELEVLVQE